MKRNYLCIFYLFLILSFAFSKEFNNLELKNIVTDYYSSDGIWKTGYSSVLLETNKSNDFYGWKNLTDGNTSTSWVEGIKGPGIGEYVCLNVLRLDEYDTLVGFNHDDGKIRLNFLINNGYCKNEDLFIKNNRVKEAIIRIYDIPITASVNSIYVKGESKKIYEKKITLQDINSQQKYDFDFTIPENEECYSAMLLLQFEIIDVYPGTDYDDTCISEIKVYGEYAEE